MQKLLEIFSTRELSLLLWIGVILIAMLLVKSIRKSIFAIFRLFFSKQILPVVIALTIYTLLSVLFLKQVSLWDKSLIKGTVFWFIGFAMVTFFTINKAKDTSFFKTILKECFKWTIFIEFFVNLYTFSLITEIIMLPIIVLFGVTQAVAQTDKKNETASKLLTNLLAIIGTFYIGYALYKTVTAFKDIWTLQNLQTFLLPLLLTVLLLPYFYLVALYLHYQELFITVDFMTNDNSLKAKLKRIIFLTANVNLNKLTSIKQKLRKADLYNSTDIHDYIRAIA
jgi:hypothetical protein